MALEGELWFDLHSAVKDEIMRTAKALFGCTTSPMMLIKPGKRVRNHCCFLSRLVVAIVLWRLQQGTCPIGHESKEHLRRSGR